MTQASILIVEDDAIIGHHLKIKLTEMGYIILDVIQTGEDALQKVRYLMPDVVLMDIRLAGQMDGITAAGEIGKTLQIPVVYLTAYADDETLSRACETHPAGYVLKPFDPRNLYVAIEMALYNHRQPPGDANS